VPEESWLFGHAILEPKMKDFISELLKIRKLDESFWRQSFAQLIVTPPTPKKISITKSGDTITIRESHSVGSWWMSQPQAFSDALEMSFRVNESGDWIPLYLKEGSNKPRLAYRIVEEYFAVKPIVARRQLAFAHRWAEVLTLKGLLHGLVDVLRNEVDRLDS
jgi:hypothetical protein